MVVVKISNLNIMKNWKKSQKKIDWDAAYMRCSIPPRLVRYKK